MDVDNRNDDLPLQSPYHAGARYSLHFIPKADSSPLDTVEVTVLEVFTPTTISPVLKVKVESTSPVPLPSTAILKLYDRRFANDLRAFHGAPKLSAASEESFRTFKSKEGSCRSLDEWKAKIFDDENADIETTPEETEAFLAVLLASYHENEVRVYERLAFMQGNCIPLFFGQTRFKNSDTHPDRIDVDVPGILIEYVEGTRLDKLPASAVSPTLCQACVDIVLTVGDHDVLNQDVRLENFIVPSSAESGRTAVMIDFAQARLRTNDEDDDHWKQAKWTIDEEGAVGYVLRKKFGWDYQPTFRYLVPAEE